jgi:hypothetical protein
LLNDTIIEIIIGKPTRRKTKSLMSSSANVGKALLCPEYAEARITPPSSAAKFVAALHARRG